MTILSLLLLSLVLAGVLMGALLVVGLRRRDMGLVDVGWAAGVGLSAILYAALLDTAPWRRWAVAGVAVLWSARLAAHILRHRVLGAPEDARYRALRERWGARAKVYVPLLYLGEAPLVTLFSLPILVALRQPAPDVSGWALAGLVVGVAAIAGEALADAQLARFRADPQHRGRTCRAGLWRLSRHPNYFFEWLHWWAYVLLAVGAPHAWVTLLGPALMLAFLFKVTGIPHAERQALASRGDDYRRYQATTSIFFPWFPKDVAARPRKGAEGANGALLLSLVCLFAANRFAIVPLVATS
ncbi:MAG: DUF1295 domain-containing protein [Lentisphaerae bacterium]|nr:DUF1295 domain-containing protein [Lentisphaerota bacterium]